MPADSNEIEVSEKEGVTIRNNLCPVKVTGTSKVEGIVFEETEGECREMKMTGRHLDEEADVIIVACGQLPNLRVLEGSGFESFEELPEKVVLAGDIVNSDKKIATAVASAVAAIEKVKQITYN